MDDEFSDIQIRLYQIKDLKIKSMKMAECHYPLTEISATSPNSHMHKCIHKISQTSQRCERELEYLFYRINVDLLRKLLVLVTCANRFPMSGHTFLALLCFGFPSFSSFSDFPSFLNFPAFHTFLLFLFYPAFWIYACFS